MCTGVKILETTQIRLPPHPLPVKLSFLDSFWVMIPPVQKLLLLPNPTLTNLSFSTILEALKSSLTTTLLKYLSLAGKLTYIPTSGDIEIDLSEPSVTFNEAESELDFHKLAGSDIHDVESFMKLVPRIDVTVMPFPALAIQVTRFVGGGIAIGYSVHHAVVDGKAMHEFMEAWASCCRAKLSGVVEIELLPREQRNKTSYDRSVIQHPRGDEIARNYYKLFSPNLPKTGVPFPMTIGEGKTGNLSPATIEEGRLGFIRQTFKLDATSIQSLKKQATQNAVNTTSRPPSTFIAVSAYTWACYVRTMSWDPSLDTIFVLLMDCRTRLNPPLEEDYFGNCLRPILVTMLVSDLIGKDGLTWACTTISKYIAQVLNDPLKDCENWFASSGNMPLDRLVNVSASPRFLVYETDFGWGKPVRFESVSMNKAGEFALVGGKEKGSVQVSIGVKPEQMEAFEKYFSGGLNI